MTFPLLVSGDETNGREHRAPDGGGESHRVDVDVRPALDRHDHAFELFTRHRECSRTADLI
jgi:hypothetical protein